MEQTAVADSSPMVVAPPVPKAGARSGRARRLKPRAKLPNGSVHNARERSGFPGTKPRTACPSFRTSGIVRRSWLPSFLTLRPSVFRQGDSGEPVDREEHARTDEGPPKHVFHGPTLKSAAW